MIFPVVHLNGTGAEALLAQYQDAHRAVTAALRALAEVTPNGRDYYLSGSVMVLGVTVTAFEQAVREHRARIDALVIVQGELMALIEHVAAPR